MTRVLITGGAGFIGSHLTSFLLEQGFKVTILDNFLSQVHRLKSVSDTKLDNKNCRVIKGCITSSVDVSRALEGVSKVVHLASETGTGQSMYNIIHHNKVNTLGTAVLLEEIIKTKGKIEKVLLASSRAVYGEGAYVCNNCHTNVRLNPSARTRFNLQKGYWDHRCVDCNTLLQSVSVQEGDYIKPASVYGATKHAQEELVRITCRANGVPFGIFRMQNVYGEGQSLINPYTGILSIFTGKILTNQKIPIFEDGLMLRDFIHVSDVVNAFQRALIIDCMDFTLNLGSGIAISVIELVKHLMHAIGCQSSYHVTGDYRLGDIRHCHADLTLLTKTLNVDPKVKLEVGLCQFAKWAITESKKYARGGM